MRRVHPRAQVEFNEAFRWYATQSFQAALQFEDELREGLLEIEMHPDRFAKYLFGTRVYMLAKFPYVIVYTNELDRYVVIALAHTKRRPGYWRRRLH